MQSLALTLLVPTEKDGQRVLETRNIHVSVSRIAYVEATPAPDQAIVQCIGGAQINVRNRPTNVINELQNRGLGASFIRFENIRHEQNPSNPTESVVHRHPIWVNESCVNFIVPNPDNTTSIQLSAGTTIQVSQNYDRVREMLGMTTI